MSAILHIFPRRLIVIGLIAAAIGLSSAVSPARAVEIVDIQWGFDGQVVAERFNMLSIRVDNNTKTPFEGVMTLRRYSGIEAVGAVLIEEVYVSEFSTKWVQFFPYVEPGGNRWVLSWGRGKSRELNVPRSTSETQPVLFIDPEDFGRRGGGLKRFDETLFPTSVTMTQGLSIAVLDHAPRWEAVRRQAFLDWISRGGTVHLLRDRSGRNPQFEDELAVLNNPVDRFRVGVGTVQRHDRQRTDIDSTFINSSIRPVPVEAQAEDQNNQPQQVQQYNSNPNNPYGYQSNFDQSQQPWFHDFALSMFTTLKEMTQPEHNWLVIYLMSLLYVVLIFPGFYLIGRFRYDYRIVYGAFFLTIFVFSLLFAFVGRRGYGESTNMHTLAIAHVLPDQDAADVTGWSNAFVTRGANYHIEHGGSGRIYSTCQQTEAVNGWINNGATGTFDVDIPPFSSRPFGFRAKLPIAGYQITPVQWQSDDRLRQLRLRVNGDFPEPALNTQIFALYGDRIYEMKLTGGELVKRPSSGFTVTQYLGTIDFDRYRYYTPFGPWSESEETSDQRFRRMHKLLMARSLDLNSTAQAQKFELPRDRVRLFVYAGMPESFRVKNAVFAKQIGYVLYLIDIPKADLP